MKCTSCSHTHRYRTPKEVVNISTVLIDRIARLFFPLGNVPKVMTLQRTTAVIQFKIANKRFESNARTDKNGIRSTRFVCVFHSFHLSSFLLHFRSTWFVVEYKIRATNPCLNGNRRSKLQTEYEFKQTQQQVYRQ